MNKIKMIVMATFLGSSLGYAAAPTCNDFELSIKNNLADHLLITKILLNGAEIQPGGILKLNPQSQQVFTINKSINDVAMNGVVVLNTLSLPSKQIKIQFDLNNRLIYCQHTDKNSGGDYPVLKHRSIGRVTYTIGN